MLGSLHLGRLSLSLGSASFEIVRLMGFGGKVDVPVRGKHCLHPKSTDVISTPRDQNIRNVMTKTTINSFSATLLELNSIFPIVYAICKVPNCTTWKAISESCLGH